MTNENLELVAVAYDKNLELVVAAYEKMLRATDPLQGDCPSTYISDIEKIFSLCDHNRLYLDTESETIKGVKTIYTVYGCDKCGYIWDDRYIPLKKVKGKKVG